jgi:hypothetical protein
VYTFTINTLDTLPLHMPGAIGGVSNADIDEINTL